MGRIRMHVFIRNESDATLDFAHDKVLHGTYTPDCSPPRRIGPGQGLGFQAEGRFTLTPSTGTEGRVSYNVTAPGSAGGELYIHWDSPLVESQYGNTFHVWAPAGWEVTHSGGQGHDATLEIRLRRSARRNVPNFDANGRGFAFTNGWDHGLPVVTLGFLWNRLFEALPGPLGELGIGKLVDENWVPITHANAGLCGGMVYAVMDYHAAHLLPPTRTTSPTSRDDALFGYCRDRLWDSFDVGGGGHRYLGYSSPAYPNGDEGVTQAVGLMRGRAWVTYREAWPLIQRDIDAGRLSPMALIQTDNLDVGSNHQVLAYGYLVSGQDVTLYIYDPNEAQKEVRLCFNITHTDGEVRVQRLGGSKENTHRIFAFFRTDGYTAKAPPGGRRPNSVREALRATGQHQVRSAIAGHAGSVMKWLQAL